MSCLFLASFKASASLYCAEIFEPHPASRDSYRAYAIGKVDAQGVQRIHVVDFIEPTLKISMNREKLTEIILFREQFNQPEMKDTEISKDFHLFIPRYPLETRSESAGRKGVVLNRALQQQWRDGVFGSYLRNNSLPRFEYEPQNSRMMLFLVELKTPTGLIELVFTKSVSMRHFQTEAAPYALHIARTLGIEVEKIWAVKLYGGGFR